MSGSEFHFTDLLTPAFDALADAKHAAMIEGLRDLQQRVSASGLDDIPAPVFKLPMFLQTVLRHPDLGPDWTLVSTQMVLDQIAQFWAPDVLHKRRNEQRVAEMFSAAYHRVNGRGRGVARPVKKGKRR